MTSEDSTLNRRRFLGAGAASIAATPLGLLAGAQPGRQLNPEKRPHLAPFASTFRRSSSPTSAGASR